MRYTPPAPAATDTDTPPRCFTHCMRCGKLKARHIAARLLSDKDLREVVLLMPCPPGRNRSDEPAPRYWEPTDFAPKKSE